MVSTRDSSEATRQSPFGAIEKCSKRPTDARRRGRAAAAPAVLRILRVQFSPAEAACWRARVNVFAPATAAAPAYAAAAGEVRYARTIHRTIG